MKIQKYTIAASALAVAGLFAVATPAFAQPVDVAGVNVNTNTHIGAGIRGNDTDGNGMMRVNAANNVSGDRGEGMMRGANGIRPAAFGKVTAISGTSLTVLAHMGLSSSSETTTYTVLSANAKVFKNNATSSLSAIAVGDTVVVMGTTNGQTITATSIRDGVVPMGRGGNMGSSTDRDQNGNGPSITGNGQPVMLGTISSINGSSVTITNKSNVSYTVDATNARIVKGNTTIAVSSLSPGDTVIVQGAVNGSAVTATSIIDTMKPIKSANDDGGPNGGGFMGAIGRFFSKIFGF